MKQTGKRIKREQPDETLKISELGFRRLFETARHGIIILDAGTGEIVDVNPFLVDLLGYSHEEFMGKKIWEIGSFKDFEPNRAAYRKLQTNKSTCFEDLQLETKEGQHRVVEFVSNIYFVGNKQLIQCNLRDITEQKRKVAELVDLAKISAENPNPVLRLAHDGTILYANEATQKFLAEMGVTKGGRVTKFWRGVVSEALKKQATNVIEAQFGGRSYSFFVSPVVNANYVNLFGRDVTERNQEEEARRSAEANYRALVEQVPAITYIDKADGSALSLFVSPQVKSILGVSEDEWIKGDASFWSNLIHPDDRERVLSAYSHTINTGEPFGEEYRMIARDGHMVWIDDHAVLLEGDHGLPNSLQGVMFDITRQKQAQALQEAVYRIAIATETTESLSDLFPQIHQIISSVMPAENFYITLYDEVKNVLHFPYFRDALDEPFLGEIEPGKGLTAHVLRTGKSLLCTQAVHDELERQGAVKLLGVPSAIWLGVPLIIEGKTIGAMVVQHYSDPEAYGERELHMLEFVSSQVAVAISRKQVEDALRESERRLQNAERIANLGSWEMDLTTGKSIWSAGFFRICGLGQDASEPIAEIESSLVHPDDRIKVAKALDQAIADKGLFSFEHRIVRPDGTVVWVDVKGEVECDTSGKPIKLLRSFLDITRQKQAQALQEAVYRIAIATETTESLSDLFPQIHQIISSVMPAENFYITLYDEVKNVLHFPYFRDALDEPFLGEIEPGKGLTAHVLRTGKSLLCTQAVHDELERQGAVKLLGVPSAIWLGVPLIIEGKTIGAMVVQHYSDPEAYGERELHMLEFVSSQVAVAIKRKQAEDALRESEERFRRIFEEGPLGMAIVGSDYRLVKVNNRLCQMLGYTQQELTALTLFDITHPEDIELDLRQAEKVFRGEIPNYAVEKRYLKRDQEVLWVNSTSSVIQVEGKSLDGLVMMEDITARKQAEEKLRQLSTHDILTGLFNRGYFEAEMARLEGGRQFPVSIVMADVDQLKETNDSQGHAAGDTLLKRLAQVLSAAFRAEDILARIGGDEFAVLLPNTGSSAVKKALIRLRRTLREHNAAHIRTASSSFIRRKHGTEICTIGGCA